MKTTLALALYLAAGPAQFAPNAAPEAAPAAKPDVAKLVKSLESDSFAERQQATNDLTRAGADAVDALVETAGKSFDLEVPTRCVNILGRMLRGDDEKAKAAAKAGLEKLSESERKFLARRAKETLEGPEQPPIQGVPGNPFGGNIRIQVGGIGGANNVRVESKTVNGQTETKVEADGKKILITEAAGKDIRMKVTEQVNGQPVTTEYKADDLADLKKKHPEAAKLYQQYAGGAGIPNINAGGIRILPNGRIQIAPGGRAIPRAILPGNARARRIQLPFVPRQNVNGAIEKLEKSLEELRKLQKDGNLPEGSVDAAIEAIEEARKQLENAG